MPIYILILLFAILIFLQNVDSSVESRFRKFSEFCLKSQQQIIRDIEVVDGEKFQQDNWETATGKGITAVLQRGLVWEKAAVSTTIVTGSLTSERAASISAKGRKGAVVGGKYSAAALSIVLHSRSPLVPTFRADVRYFELGDGLSGWFGGGADLTPFYLFDQDVSEFHTYYKSLCDCHAEGLYKSLKKWCDSYFYLPARGEHRGTGGIFFDDLDDVSTINYTPESTAMTKITEKSPSSIPSEVTDVTLDKAMEFTEDVCRGFMPSYLPIVQRRHKLPYSDAQRHFQLLRRGRYIEFNLLYDRGVRFGLVPGGRVEAVMVSCPPLVAWDYGYVPPQNSDEERLLSILKNPRDWA